MNAEATVNRKKLIVSATVSLREGQTSPIGLQLKDAAPTQSVGMLVPERTANDGRRFRILFMPGVADPFNYLMERGINAASNKAGADLVVAEYPKAWGPANQIPILQAT